MWPQRVGFLCHFGLKTGVDFTHFGLELGMVFKETTRVYEQICRLKNEKERVISEFEMGFKKSCLSSSLNSTHTRSENRYGFKRPGIKTGVENTIF